MRSWGIRGSAVLCDQENLRAIAQQDTFLYVQGETLWGHEVHRSHLTDLPDSPLYHLRPYDPQSPYVLEGWHLPNLHASYLHLH
ncbi:MAG: hypothetical protein Fur0046_13400 [Cyanobacteria bacterium J069]